MTIQTSKSSDATFPKVLDSSMLATAKACPVKFYYQYCHNLAPSSKSIHLHAGGSFARGLEVARKAFYLEKQSPLNSIIAGLHAFMSYWGGEENDPPEDHAKTFVNVAYAFLDYFREYPLATDLVQPHFSEAGTPAIEFTFALPLPINHPITNDPLIYGGRLDMLGYYNNFSCVVDEKTTYAFSYNWARQWGLRGQFIGYVYAARQYGFETNTALIRGIAIQKKEIKHMQAISQYPDHLIKRWYENMLKKVDQLVIAYNKNEWDFDFADACNAYGGCEMFDLCEVEKPEEWFDSYEKRYWNPLEKDPTLTEIVSAEVK